MNALSFKQIFNRRGLLVLSSLVLVCVVSGLWLVFNAFSPSVTVDYIDVGQGGLVGDSILLRSSDGKVVLIDGGYPNSGALAYLQAQQVTHIDLMVVTHAHDDHTGGLSEILRALPVDLLVSNGQPLLDSPIYTDFENAIRESGVATRVVKAGDTLPFGRLEFQVLSPRKINPNGHNNNSIVLRLAVGRVAFLFTGDTQELEENRLLATNAKVQADILKVAHHGSSSSSSSAFIERVHPAVAIYSSGKENMHGLPEQVTLDKLDTFGILVYGTDFNGTITVTTDGRTYHVSPAQGGPLGGD